MLRLLKRHWSDLKLKPLNSKSTPSSSTTASSPSSCIKVLFNCLPNNIHIAVTEPASPTAATSSATSRLLFKLSSGSVGLNGASKTALKAVPLLLDALKNRLPLSAQESGVRVGFRGISTSRPHLISGLRRLGLRILEVADSTGTPFNGCRPKKSRRL